MLFPPGIMVRTNLLPKWIFCWEPIDFLNQCSTKDMVALGTGFVRRGTGTISRNLSLHPLTLSSMSCLTRINSPSSRFLGLAFVPQHSSIHSSSLYVLSTLSVQGFAPGAGSGQYQQSAFGCLHLYTDYIFRERDEYRINSLFMDSGLYFRTLYNISGIFMFSMESVF